ncbi:hypothetical protein [Streptomyces halstedii]|uniref:SpoIIE family protein phosphatase n=1 Tax=Streptomyces halstedii TaxID=1944 RepID=A0A6N9UEG0_STRHA|nr:hypothetical protein [Streptomyces halstedii]NEA19345.1 hypothetical protein [Streptomyces halstedii]
MTADSLLVSPSPQEVPRRRASCTTHADDPQALTDALVTAATADEKGYRDDATVVVLLRRSDKPAFVRD